MFFPTTPRPPILAGPRLLAGRPESVQPELDWFELALDLLARRAKIADLADFKLRMKWLKYLLGRGFTQEQGRYALSALQEREL